MIDISIQIRKVTDKVKQYYSLFGYSTFTQFSSSYSKVKGIKRMGFEEIECVISDTARGTSIGFYPKNQLQNILYSLPLLIGLILIGLSKIELFTPYLTGDIDQTNVRFNFIQLLFGDLNTSFFSISFLILLSVLFILSPYLTQKIRIDILKSRFSFYSKDAVWETKDIPQSLIILNSIKSPFYHGWLILILYFLPFSTTNEVLIELTEIYNTSTENLKNATIEAFSITGGLILGLLSSYKSIKIRAEISKNDKRYRNSGGLTERRIYPILFGIQSALTCSIIFAIFLSISFFSIGSAYHIGMFLFFSLIGGLIAGIIEDEGLLWNLGTYAICIFFSSLLLIFQTGQESAFAYIVILQLFFIPIPFVMMISIPFQNYLEKNGMRNLEWLFDIFPFFPFVTLYLKNKNKRIIKNQYVDRLKQNIEFDSLSDQKIQFSKEFLYDVNSNSHKIIRHYFELIFSYTASFDENHFVIFPTVSQMNNWWLKNQNQKLSSEQFQFLSFSDKLLWDPEYIPDDDTLSSIEQIGLQMVFSLN